MKAFTAAGVDCLIVDSLSSGHCSFVPADVPLVVASILDTGTVARAMAEHHVTGVVHLAGFKYAGVSVREPLLTFEQNVEGAVSLLRAMETADVGHLVFSSSAAVYGTPKVARVTDETATGPESPYGESKLAGEWLVRDQGIATGLKHTSLRYFNVVGSGSPELYDSSPHNLFPYSSGRWPQGKHRRSSATTTAPRTEPASGTSYTLLTSPRHTWPQHGRWTPAYPSSGSTNWDRAKGSPYTKA